MACLNNIDFHLFIESLTRTIEIKDVYTAGHSRRVSEIAELIGKGLHLSKEHCDSIHVLGHLHDIGKIGIAEGILMKSGKLSPAEYQVMQQHAVIGASIFDNLPGLEKLGAIIRHHHERFDGKGYPDNLRHDQIPLESAIIALADSFDAMTTFRPYKSALTVEQAFVEIERNRGTQFHPDLCDLFLDLFASRQDMLPTPISSQDPVDPLAYVPPAANEDRHLLELFCR